jgi:hypothetical protein
MAQTQTVEQVHNALGVRLYKRRPEDFDPVTADHRELLVYGYPPRPDEKHPHLLERWERMMSKPMNIIEPQFSLRTDKLHGPKNAVANDTSTNWSGSVAFVARGDSATWVAGQWTVPDVVAPGGGDYYSSAWVGIDGDGSNDVLQAGTESEIVSGSRQTYAWWEWYPDFEVEITNLPVSAGDIMYCLICVHSATEAGFYIHNVTTGVATSFSKTAPSGTSLVGNCAEWIVEAPTVGGGQSRLARYGDVYFDEGVAATKNGTLLHPGTGTPITMVDGSNNQISVPKFENDEVIRVAYA